MVQINSSGDWKVTWLMPLASAPVTLPIPISATAEPVVCNAATSTTTGASGRCWYACTLHSTFSLRKALIRFALFGAPANVISVQVLAIQPTHQARWRQIMISPTTTNSSRSARAACGADKRKI